LLQLLLAATVANLTLVAGKMAQTNHSESDCSSVFSFCALRGAANGLIAALRGFTGRWLGITQSICDLRAVLFRQFVMTTTPIKSGGFRLVF